MNLSVRLIGVLTLLAGCSCRRDSPSPIPPSTQPVKSVSQPIRLKNVSDRAGITFKLGHGGRTPLTILETSGGGCAFLDYDGDGWPDILLAGPNNLALYHNLQNGTFQDVTGVSGLKKEGYWMGCAVGDYDGDGRPDIFLTGYHCYALYHNEGGGKFLDVTAGSGISGLDWSLSAAFADVDGNGKLDLYVSQYLKFDKSTEQICTVGTTRSACGPEVYHAISGKLFKNVDGHRFAEASWKDTGKTWGVLISDFDGTGKPSLYLANDMMPGDMWRRSDGKWQNVGPSNGTAYDGQGHLQGGMGVDSGDYDNDGRLDLIVTTYFAQPASIYHNDGNGFYTYASGRSGVGPPTTPFVGFGTRFVDLDNDGWLDLIITNGHVRDNVHDFDASQTYAQPIQVFHNDHGHFDDCSSTVGSIPHAVGRGLAIADYDHDGRMDVLICNLEGEAILLHNDTTTIHHWLEVRLSDKTMNTAAVGALVQVDAGALRLTQEIRTCGSVLSSSQPMAHFGLGEYAGPVKLTIRWPDGRKHEKTVDKLDSVLTVSRP